MLLHNAWLVDLKRLRVSEELVRSYSLSCVKLSFPTPYIYNILQVPLAL